MSSYVIEVLHHPTPCSDQWVDDAIGENAPRSIEACEADIAAFRHGDCGPEMAACFQSRLYGLKYRIAPREE